MEKQHKLHCRTPFITVKVEPELGTTELRCKPNILELHTIVSRCFDKIIKVAATIPKIQTILFPELDQVGRLFPISRYEDTVMKDSRMTKKKTLIKSFMFVSIQ